MLSSVLINLTMEEFCQNYWPQKVVHEKECMIDIYYSCNIKKNMDEQFTTYAENYMVNGVPIELISFSLWLTLCNDGGMWSLVCNPTHHSKLGAVMLFNHTADIGAEQYFIDVLHDEELKALEKGMVIVVQGDGMPDQHIFLQARLVIYTHVDTPALGPGCMSESVFSCSRNSLPLSHTLRKIGV